MFVPQTPPRLPSPHLPNVMVALSILIFYVKKKVLYYFFENVYCILRFDIFIDSVLLNVNLYCGAACTVLVICHSGRGVGI